MSQFTVSAWKRDRYFRAHDRRYYSAWLQQDLFGTWTVIRHWGSVDRTGLVQETPVSSYEAGARLLQRVAARRRQHGYRRVSV